MKIQQKIFDVVVIGGGPAGMMAAGRAAELGAKVVLVDRNEKLGKKLLLTGKGRCNITHAEFNNKEFLKAFGSNGKFLFSGFKIFGPQQVVDFFESRGVKTKIEQGKRIFPKYGTASNVLNCLINYLREGKVVIKNNSRIFDIKLDGNVIKEIVTDKKERITANNFIIATGGKSFPQTGSTGNGFELAKKLGHNIITLMPALVPIKTKENWPKKLQGLSLKNVGIKIIQNNTTIIEKVGELLFTHFGVSGPMVMNVSQKIGELLNDSSVELLLDLKPGLSLNELDSRLQKDFAKYSNKNFKNALDDLLPQKIIETIIRISGVSSDKKICQITKIQRQNLVNTIKGLKMTVSSLLGFEHAVVTNGGVDLKEIDSRTMRSKIISNLYFAGEVIDIDGPSGGYNLQNCWTTGYLAGQNAANVNPRSTLC